MSPVQVITSGFAGSFIAGLATSLGAVPIFVRARWSERAQGLMLALAAGVMLGAAVVGLSQALLPWGLATAAGAMLFVISGEIIPETHRAGRERAGTFTLVAGFVLMMLLDVTLA